MSSAADFLSDSDLAWWDEPAQPEQHCAGAAVPLGEDGSKRCAFREVPVGNTSPTACALAATCGMRKQVLAGEDEWQTVLVRRTDGEAPPEDAAFWDDLKAKARASMHKRRVARLAGGNIDWAQLHQRKPLYAPNFAEAFPRGHDVTAAARTLKEHAPKQWAKAIDLLAQERDGTDKATGLQSHRGHWTGADAAMRRLSAFDAEHGAALRWVLTDEEVKARAAELALATADSVMRIYAAHGVADTRATDAARARLAAFEQFTAATAGKTAAQVRKETGRALDLWAAKADMSPAQIKDATHMLDRLTLAMAEAVEFVRQKCTIHQVDAPQVLRRVAQHEAVQGAINRAKDPIWWRRKLRRAAARIVEAGAIKLGAVNRRTGGYCSEEALSRRKQQLARNANNLATTLMKNEAGQVFSLAELAASSVSNPVNRGGELMTRIRGCEEFADAAGHVGLFLTLTAPSAMHRMLSKEWRSKGEPDTADAYKAIKNPRYDGVSSPRDAQQWLTGQWAKVRSTIKRKGIDTYGFRVAEPHHDGTPHWHALLWCKTEADASELQAVVRRFWIETDKRYSNEPGATKNRTNVKRLEKGGAAGYIAKYIAKSIGHHTVAEHLDTAGAGGDMFTVEMGGHQGHMRVDAWAATWGIRQFQAIGQPSVTVWREVRRVTEDQVRALSWHDNAAAKLAWDASQKIGDKAASWADYLNALGGVCLPRADYALQPAKRENRKANKYGETQAMQKVVGVRTCSGKWLVSRRLHWAPLTGTDETVQAKARMAQGETPQDSATRTALAVPWTGFNNCNARLKRGHANWLYADAEKLEKLADQRAQAGKQADANTLIAQYLAPIYADQLEMFGATPESITQAAPLHASELLGAMGMPRSSAIAAMQRDGWLQAPRQYAAHAPIAVPQTTPERDAAMEAMAEALGF